MSSKDGPTQQCESVIEALGLIELGYRVKVDYRVQVDSDLRGLLMVTLDHELRGDCSVNFIVDPGEHSIGRPAAPSRTR
jgi:hypothetical protein